MSDEPNPLAAAIEQAPVVAEPAPPEPDDSAPPKRRSGGRDLGLPDGCPVQALGVMGEHHVFLDAAGQYRAISAGKLTRTMLRSLFGRHQAAMESMWPRTDKAGNIIGFDADRCLSAMIAATEIQGIWNAQDRIRGVGGWRGEDGELVLHYGDAVWIGPRPGEDTGGRIEKPGLVGRYVYPAGAVQPRPASVVSPADQTLQRAYEDLQTWNWRRGELDARLLMGWLGITSIAGALDKRPAVWITGTRYTGKTTCVDFCRALLDGGYITSEDPSSAYLKNMMAQASIPVILDEREPEEDPRRNNQLIQLMRISFTGGSSGRGTADHGTHETRIVSPMLFASIIVPPLLPQDKSRLALLQLNPLPPGTAGKNLDLPWLRRAGAILRQRMLTGWPRWGECLAFYQQRLIASGHAIRGGDVYGALLAAADLLLDGGVPEPGAADVWLDQLSAEEVAEQLGDMSDEELCLAYLLGSKIDRGHHSWRAVSELIVNALDDEAGYEDRKALARHGLSVRDKPGAAAGAGRWLVVAHEYPALDDLFRGKPWAAGGWRQALARLPGAEVNGPTVNFAGSRRKGTWLPIDALGLDPRSPDLPERGSAA